MIAAAVGDLFGGPPLLASVILRPLVESTAGHNHRAVA